MMTDKNRAGQLGSDAKSEISRRKFLDRIFLTVAGGAAIMVIGTKEAQAKVSKSAAKYRGSPKLGRSCGKCARYQGNGKCSKVKGTVSANGYCNYYSRRNRSGSY